VVSDPETKKKLAGALTDLAHGVKNPSANAIESAPIVIVACAELGKSGYYKEVQSTDKGDWFMFDVALAMQNLMLAAHAIGLGTVHIGLFDAKEMAEIIDVPEGVEVVEITPLGYADETPGVIPRKELSEIVFRGKYSGK
jgi:nitroreductase